MPQLFPMNWILISMIIIFVMLLTMILTFFFKFENILNVKKEFKNKKSSFLFKW
nr:ATP synthase F0 subunit 8 [Haemaphysalis kolonini]UWI72009.1 ATP synthase F0 subunit 8 [Haemaphysalis yeni]